MLPDQKSIIELKKGDEIVSFFLLKSAEVKRTKNNTDYLYLELMDNTASISARMWDKFKDILPGLNSGVVVKVQGNIEEYNGAINLIIKKLRPCNELDNVLPEDFYPRSEKDPEQLKKQFLSRIKNLTNPYLKTLMDRIFNEEMFKKFASSPAAKAWHHAYLFGLIEHTLEIIKICELMADIHPEINKDLLISGAMLHDFGKIEELDINKFFAYTDKGKLLGHIVISAMKVNEEINRINDFPEDLRNCLIHLILSHQGKLEYASPVVPKTLEAITLYHADELSAKVNAYSHALKVEDKTDKWTKRIRLADTELFDHGII